MELILRINSKIRTLKIKYNNSILIRPVRRVYHLEIQTDPSDICCGHLQKILMDPETLFSTDSYYPDSELTGVSTVSNFIPIIDRRLPFPC